MNFTNEAEELKKKPYRFFLYLSVLFLVMALLSLFINSDINYISVIMSLVMSGGCYYLYKLTKKKQDQGKGVFTNTYPVNYRCKNCGKAHIERVNVGSIAPDNLTSPCGNCGTGNLTKQV